MPDRCQWLFDRYWIMIPGCIGAAVGGPHDCTCDIKGSKLEQAQRGREIAEGEVLRLHKRAERRGAEMAHLARRNRLLWEENHRLERAGAHG